MINHAIVIDSDKTSRENLAHRLSAIGVVQNLQFSSCEEASNALKSSENYLGILFIKIEENLKPALEFVGKFKEKNADACFIPVVTAASLETMKTLIQNDADQILDISCAESELKRKINQTESYRKRMMSDDITNPSIPTFEATFEQLAEGYDRIRMIGSFVENCDLPVCQPKTNGAVLFIDCEHLRVINSVGIKLWLNWMKSLVENGYSQIRFQKLKPGYLQLASFVQGFIPSIGHVDSFYLHYVNDELNVTKDFKFIFNMDSGTGHMKIPKIISCQEDNKRVAYELDDSAPLILRYFKGHVQVA